MPASTGLTKFRRRLSSEARRQAMSGPTPIRNRRPRKSGMLMVLKYGPPTLTFSCHTAS
jgi:hypothetical protein